MEYPLQTKPYDSADYLDSEEAIVTYLKVAFEDGDADDICTALNVVTRAPDSNFALAQTTLN